MASCRETLNAPIYSESLSEDPDSPTVYWKCGIGMWGKKLWGILYHVLLYKCCNESYLGDYGSAQISKNLLFYL